MAGKTSTKLHVGVIMAGGAGERFWPLSRRDRPKQLLCLTDPDRSMLAVAVERLRPVVPPEQTYIITGTHLVAPTRAAQVGVPNANIVAEPLKRNTAGALCYITAHLMAVHPELAPEDLVIAVSTADHNIGDPALFADTLRTAIHAAEQEEALVVCGIVPTAPETGFGYVQADTAAPAVSEPIPVYPVNAFHEKPNHEVAEDFVAAGNYFWNSGMFFWTAQTFLRELRAVRPDMAAAVDALTAAIRAQDTSRIHATFEAFEDISIDFALMEHAKRVLMVRGDFSWGDVGAWSALGQLHAHDRHGNVAIGDPILVNAQDCVVYNAAGNRKIAVGVASVAGLVVVVTDDAVLVVPRERAQDVRHIVAELKRREAEQL
ncbi:MAG: mannose-1-phosphate guanylyltransferase [Candidatus Hydrogenedentota bacterium]